MKNHVTTSAAVNKELTEMSEQVTDRDYLRAIIAVTALTVTGLIIACLVIFGVPTY